MHDMLDFLNNVFNAGLGITLCLMLWHLVHPEHFAWLKSEKPPVPVQPSTMPRGLRVTGWIAWFVIMFGAAAFGVFTLLTRG